MMKQKFKLLLLLAMISATAMAQVQFDKVKIPADTRLYLQILEKGNRQMHNRSKDATVKQQEAKLFVSCAPDADTKAIEAQIKAAGAKPQGTIGRYIMVSAPVGAVSKIADIDGVTYISKGPSVSRKTLLSREREKGSSWVSSTVASTYSILRSRMLRATLASKRSIYQAFHARKVMRW